MEESDDMQEGKGPAKVSTKVLVHQGKMAKMTQIMWVVEGHPETPDRLPRLALTATHICLLP